jgi:hypothetical protein
MHEVMTDWTDRKRGGEAAGGASSSNGTVLPPGPGEWDEGLGIPLCVVCQGVCLSVTMLNSGAYLTYLDRLTRSRSLRRRAAGEKSNSTTFCSS